MASDPKVKNEVEASQGTKTPGLIYVLIAGVVLVIIAFGIVWSFQHH